MNLNLTPVKVNIDIESLSLERDAFYNVCFITENETAPRTLEISKLKDLLSNGYNRFSLAYNFCVGVFAQQGMSSIKIRAKRASESYEDAFDADDNSGYYFLVIEDKNRDVVAAFNEHVTTSDNYKLLFYSSDIEAITNSELVQYYQKPLSNSDLIGIDLTTISNHYLNGAFNTGYDINKLELATVEQLQQARLAYPESAWVSFCGNKFPSSVQWLYKYLAKVDTNEVKVIPELTSTTSTIISNKSTVGSGTTTYGTPIHEKVSIDWVKWALSRRVWNTLYTKEKVNATKGGLELITNEVKVVLDTAISESIFTDYRIVDTTLNRNTNTVSVKFTASLSYTILEVELSGSLYY